MAIRRTADHTLVKFLTRTVSAQIHLLSALLFAGALGYLLPLASAKGPSHFWACLIFGLTGIGVFMASATYHFLDDGYVITKNMRTVLDHLDHYSISLFIAGTYTPILLNAVSQPWCGRLLILVWSIAFTGILYRGWRHLFPKWAQHRFVSTGLYVLMGWILIFRFREVKANMSVLGLQLLLAGGVAYSVGAVVYATEKPSLFKRRLGAHEIWHLFVTAGAAFHYGSVFIFYK